MLGLKKKLKLYFVKTPAGNMALCTRTGMPIISEFSEDGREKIHQLLCTMKEKDSRYIGCTISALKEI